MRWNRFRWRGADFSQASEDERLCLHLLDRRAGAPSSSRRSTRSMLNAPLLEEGCLVPPDGPGWGAEWDEEHVKALTVEEY